MVVNVGRGVQTRPSLARCAGRKQRLAHRSVARCVRDVGRACASLLATLAGTFVICRLRRRGLLRTNVDVARHAAR
eukprot:4244937-Alexandrium_andersonii.AAC.1